MPSSPEARIPEIRQALWQLNESLLSAADPGEIETSLGHLDQTALHIRALSLACSPAAEEELLALREDLERASQLVRSGLALQHGWANVLGSLAGEYMASGEAAPLGVPSQIVVKG